MFSNIFSATFAGQTSVKSHVIMSRIGDDNGTGTWTCTKDHRTHCGHIMNARHKLQRLVWVDPTTMDGALHEEITEHVVPGVLYLWLWISMLTIHQCKSTALRNLKIRPSPISQCTRHHGPPYQMTLWFTPPCTATSCCPHCPRTKWLVSLSLLPYSIQIFSTAPI